ncbi:glycosyltransferase [Pseudohoeflea coraliihabitans]|uniref:Glycosyltransferase n=1 Tax=Pseudohoeflea coraliihabitans TaxID=2860393 RepID=A0ABS6WJF6_9HYPH|nr:glycosyltransferase [Pseudohoeflea sp. DP4N28-3]MBW3096076.1 glycosyltransferase [Pseudohoeflea sp. DP4N28-3]
MPIDDVNATPTQAGDTATDMPAIFLDVSGILQWGHQPPTGIQRVEIAIARQAAERADITLVSYDRLKGRYHTLTPAHRSYLDSILEGSRLNQIAELRAGQLPSQLGLQLQFRGKELGRQIAQKYIGASTRGGLHYTAVKTAIRLYGRLYALSHRLAGKAHGPAPASSEGPRAILISHEFARNDAARRAAVHLGAQPVYLVYDIIPIRQPQFVSARFAATMDAFINRWLATDDPMLTISQAVKTDIVALSRDRGHENVAHRIQVCPLGSSLAASDAASRPIEILLNRRFALYCSSLTPHKRQDVLVDAWIRLNRLLPAEDLPDLVLIGRAGKIMPKIDSLLDGAPETRSKVHVLTDIQDDQLAWAYRNASLGLFASVNEGWGLGVSESLAYGLPIVHSAAPSLREASQGLMPVVEGETADAWVEMLKPLFLHPERIAALRETIKAQYQPGTPGDFARDVLSAVASHAGPRPADQI